MKSRITLSRILLPFLAAGILGVVATNRVAAQPPNPSNPIKLTKGVVTDTRTGKPVDGGKVFVYHSSKSDPVAQSKINPSTGAFQVVLGPSSEYRVVLRSNRYLPSEATIQTPGGMNYEEVIRNLTMEPIPIGRTLFSGRLFDAGVSTVKPNAELATALAFMKQSPAATVTITVIPDVAGSKAAAKAAAKPKKKKSKKGAAAAEPAPTLTTSTTATQSSQDPMTALGQARMQALRTFLQKETISLTRIKWEVPATPTEIRAAGGGKENVVITINGVDVEEVEEEDS